MKKTVIGWIGTGVMGESMCGHLMKAGYPMNVYNRTKEKASGLIDRGANWMKPTEVAKNSDMVIMMLGYPKDVEEMSIGSDGIVKHMRKGSYLIDHTTSKPQLAIKIYEECQKYGVNSIDAPVSGGDVGAREGKLAIMCGGDREPFEAAKAVMAEYGKNIQLNGTAGMGQHTKMVNQIVLAGNMIGLVEGLLYASKMGLDPLLTLQTIGTGGAGSTALNNLGPRMVKRNFDPGFYVEHFIKDLEIALEQCSSADLCLPNLALVKQFYVALKAQGGGRLGSQALIKVLQNMNNHSLEKTTEKP